MINFSVARGQSQAVFKPFICVLLVACSGASIAGKAVAVAVSVAAPIFLPPFFFRFSGCCSYCSKIVDELRPALPRQSHHESSLKPIP